MPCKTDAYVPDWRCRIIYTKRLAKEFIEKVSVAQQRQAGLDLARVYRAAIATTGRADAFHTDVDMSALGLARAGIRLGRTRVGTSAGIFRLVCNGE